VLPFDPDEVTIELSKHFRNSKMRKWDWDMHDLREALRECNQVIPRGTRKLEIWTRKGGSKKLVVVYDSPGRTAFIITGTEGRR